MTGSAEMFARECVDELGKRMEEIGNRVISGQMTDYAAYKDATGRIKGLRDAIEVLRANVTARNIADTDESDLPEMPR
jgi:hypothetical protein